MRPLCIYHGNCADGFTAAWIVNRCYQGEVDFFAAVHQQPPPDVKDREVIMVDFCYKHEVMRQIGYEALNMLVLDHHKSAQKEISYWVPEKPFDLFGLEDIRSEGGTRYNLALFDMERSGAGMTWDFFFPNTPRPRLVTYVEDRDLWRFKYPETRAVNANIFSHEYTFENWDDIHMSLENNLGGFSGEGYAIERKHHKDIKELLLKVTRPMKFWTPEGPCIVPVANLPYTMVSDGGHYLLSDRNFDGKDAPGITHPFAACYYDSPDGRNFSFRADNKMDVSVIASHYGGGGHANAAGVRIPFDQLAQFEP